MALAAGTRLGPYEILAPIGAGGMGEVYKARDTKLDREVAVKVLPVALAQDPERLVRFEREAKVLASLNHPNIAQIYGVEDRALIMEFVEGATLQGPLPLETALNYARQIADALEAAHEKNIIHRDLKPANIMITPAGVVKVLDFGLAAVAQSSDPSNPANSPTLTISPTRAGMILGTAGYMSPEQARGKAVDRRADIWAFGVVLFEILTGKQLFQGETVSDTLAHVLTKEPDWEQVPAKVRRLLKRCLEKDPKRRLRDIGDAWELLEEPTVPVAAAKQGAGRWVWPGVATVVTIALAALGFVHFREKPPEARVVRFQIGPPASDVTMLFPQFSVSPDGRKVAFSAGGTRRGQASFWIRSLDTQEPRPLDIVREGTAARVAFWSADSRFLVFVNAGKINKIDITGGPAQPLCDVPTGGLVSGGFWTRDNKIVFGTSDGLRQVSAAGGISAPLTTVDRSQGETSHSRPSPLPDGRHFLYTRASDRAENTGIYLGSLDARPEAQSTRRLLDISDAAYAPSPDGGAYLLFVRRAASPQGGRRRGTLMAQPFDTRKLELAGEAVPVAEQVNSFDVSANGVLIYQAGFVNGALVATPTWFDRQGNVSGTAAEPGRYLGVALSPDATRLAGARADPQNDDIWLYEFASGNKTRFTFGPGQRLVPVWSPDGTKIVFSSSGKGLYEKASNLSGEEALLFKHALAAPSSWSPDGRFVLFDSPNDDSKKQTDVWVLPVDGPESAPHSPIALIGTEFNEHHAIFSPDGMWIAYSSDQSGRDEIYVRPFNPASPGKPSSEGLHLVSNNGAASALGMNAFWRGKDLFYTAPDGTVKVVEVATSPAFKAAVAKPVFRLPALATLGDVTADGKRFLVLVPAGGDTAQAAPYSVVVNWTAGLKK
jgi:Tol biopolymer transport system component/predicted Ser/Thr protein kinase